MGGYNREVVHLHYWTAYVAEMACHRLEQYARKVDLMLERDRQDPPEKRDTMLVEETALVHRMLERAQSLRDEIYKAGLIPPRYRTLRAAEYLYIDTEIDQKFDPEHNVEHIPDRYVLAEDSEMQESYRLRELLDACECAAHTPEQQMLRSALRLSEFLSDMDRELRDEHLIRL